MSVFLRSTIPTCIQCIHHKQILSFFVHLFLFFVHSFKENMLCRPQMNFYKSSRIVMTFISLGMDDNLGKACYISHVLSQIIISPTIRRILWWCFFKSMYSDKDQELFRINNKTTQLIKSILFACKDAKTNKCDDILCLNDIN